MSLVPLTTIVGIAFLPDREGNEDAAVAICPKARSCQVVGQDLNSGLVSSRSLCLALFLASSFCEKRDVRVRPIGILSTAFITEDIHRGSGWGGISLTHLYWAPCTVVGLHVLPAPCPSQCLAWPSVCIIISLPRQGYKVH